MPVIAIHKRDGLDTTSSMGPVWIAFLAISMIVVLGLLIAGLVWISRWMTARQRARERGGMVLPITGPILNNDKRESMSHKGGVQEMLRQQDEVIRQQDAANERVRRLDEVKERMGQQEEEDIKLKLPEHDEDDKESVSSQSEDEVKVLEQDEGENEDENEDKDEDEGEDEGEDEDTTVISISRNNRVVSLGSLMATARPLSLTSSLTPPRSPEMARQRQQSTNSREEVFRYHRYMGTVPRPFSLSMDSTSSAPRIITSPTPFNDANPATPPSLPPLSEISPGLVPFLGSNRQSFQNPSTLQVPQPEKDKRWSAVSSVVSISSPEGDIRKVRTLFDPILPDELRVAHLRERLTVIQSFDDGWCVVGRDTSGANTSILSGTSDGEDSKVELGVIPLWCFLNHGKGEVPERPARTTSLGITVMEPAADDESEVTNRWSNYRAIML